MTRSPSKLDRAMARTRSQLEPVVGHDAARYTPIASLFFLIALGTGLVALGFYVAATVSRAAVFTVTAAVFGVVVLVTFLGGWYFLVKTSRAASQFVSQRVGRHVQFWGAYATAAAWQRAIERKLKSAGEAPKRMR